jgi:hypothetical protein
MRHRYSARFRRMHELVVAAASSLKLPAIRLQELDQLTTLHRVYYTHRAAGQAWQRSENVALDAFSCATVPVLSEGGPAKWLKNKNLQNHLCDYEPGGREFESLRAHQYSSTYAAQILTSVLFDVLCYWNP